MKMVVVPKIVQKKEAVKSIVLNSNGISRIDISEKLKIDKRTVIAYLNEMIDYGLIRKEKVQGKRGRPVAIFHPNIDDFMFLGIYMKKTSIEGVITTAYGVPVKTEAITISIENETKFSIIQKILTLIERFNAIAGKKVIMGVGFVVSRWLKFSPVFPTLMTDVDKIVSQEFGFEVKVGKLPIDVLAYYAQNLYQDYEDIVAIHIGQIIELSRIKNGEIAQESRNFENNLSGFNYFKNIINSEYLLDKDCLENWITKGAIVQRLQNGKQPVENYDEFKSLLEAGNRDACKLFQQNAIMFGKALIEVFKNNPPQKIILFGLGNETIDNLVEKTVMHYSDDSFFRDLNISVCHINSYNITLAAANMVSHEFLLKYLKKNKKAV